MDGALQEGCDNRAEQNITMLQHNPFLKFPGLPGENHTPLKHTKLNDNRSDVNTNKWI